ncbi:MAG: hypothetical protein A3H33_08960 [Betaproteobacteria bacterium RIFCSPLOWO2_02_FULL_65_20]|nr:MAG: hypothetical protein A3H33_08960 [Betaproteobacteria bacterium RIFCSPLOWO2_02_FULL_65_20]
MQHARIVLVGHSRFRFQECLLLTRRKVSLLDYHFRGLKTDSDIAMDKLSQTAAIPCGLCVHQISARLHRLSRRGQRRKQLVAHRYGGRGPISEFLAGRDDHGDGVADVSRFLAFRHQNRAVSYIVSVAIATRQIARGNDFPDTGHRLCRPAIDLKNPGTWMGAEDDLAVMHAWQSNVCGILGLPGYLASGVDARHAFAYDVTVSHGIFLEPRQMSSLAAVGH